MDTLQSDILVTYFVDPEVNILQNHYGTFVHSARIHLWIVWSIYKNHCSKCNWTRSFKSLINFGIRAKQALITCSLNFPIWLNSHVRQFVGVVFALSFRNHMHFMEIVRIQMNMSRFQTHVYDLINKLVHIIIMIVIES